MLCFTHRSLAICAGISLSLAALSAEAANMYRYVNDEGNVVLDYGVPPEHAHKGYEVLNEAGIVIQVVPRTLSEEERAARSEEDRAAEAAAAEVERLRKWDESLLLRYSSVADIEAARDRALSELRIRLSILQGNTRSLRQQVENEQARAADIERRGGKVPVSILTAIDDLQSEIGTTERSIAERRRELEAVNQEFQRDIDRFGELREMVELRRSHAAENSR